MVHRCKVTVPRTECFADLQKRYLADSHSGPCPCYHAGDEYLLERQDGKDDFWHMGLGTLTKAAADPAQTAGGPGMPFCSEAWDAIGRYIYTDTALQGGSVMARLGQRRPRDDRLLQRWDPSGRLTAYGIERIDVPEKDEERVWLAGRDFSNSADDAHTGA